MRSGRRLTRDVVAIVALSGLVGGGLAVAYADAAAAERVEFSLADTPEGATEIAVTVQLRCDGETVAETELVPGDGAVEQEWTPGESCDFAVTSPAADGTVDEVGLVATQDEQVVERHQRFTSDGEVAGQEFAPLETTMSVEVTAGALPEDEAGIPLKTMAFNIWNGGMLNSEEADHDWGPQNLDKIGEFVRDENPDILFMVETYGAGEGITTALNAEQSDREYTGTRITTKEDDNLWLFTHLDVEETYLLDEPGYADSFNFGGARLGLGNGDHVHAFSTWLTNKEGASPWARTNRAAMEEASGVERTETIDEMLDSENDPRLPQAREILEEELPALVDDDAPVILGGDFNTLSYQDWGERYADAPGHEGLVLDWPVMKEFADAGFVDTFRHVNPDARLYPGRTFSPGQGFGYVPGRIDYILAKGDDVSVTGSSTRSVRMESHQGDEIDRFFPFYSDHGAVVSEMVIRGEGPGPQVDPDAEPAGFGPKPWPDTELPGEAVAPEELSASADNEHEDHPASYAVDGDLKTHWHSGHNELSHNLTVDLGEQRSLAGVRYVPQVDASPHGTIVEYRLSVSDDGEEFTEVDSGSWDRDPYPRDIELDGVDARYLRLTSDNGVNMVSRTAELIPWE